MYRPGRIPAAHDRRGVILLVVITLLTLFAAIGLTFVMYAESEATASRVFREAQDVNTLPFNGEPFDNIMSWGIGELIYDAPDDANGCYSSLRGHSLARSMYGWYNPATNPNTNVNSNTVPFSGTGRLHFTNNTIGQDDYTAVNYSYFPSTGFIRDPERPNVTRTDPSQPQGGTWYGGFNPPYTYPDENNMYLAAVKADDTVLVPSFHRLGVFGPLGANTHWTDAQGKYLSLRPRPIDHTPNFPYPVDAGGDVQNLRNSGKGYNGGTKDSIWIDLGYPVKSYIDSLGRPHPYKPLFAFLVRDLDSLVNVNAHGNILATDTTTGTANVLHASHQGWGKWEASLAQVLNEPTAPTEWNQLLLGNGTIPGRYGFDKIPTGSPATAPMANPPLYSPYDYNAVKDPPAAATYSDPIQLPGYGQAATTSFPLYNQGWSSGSGNELTNHPSIFDLLAASSSQPGAGTQTDWVFPVSELRKMLCNDTAAGAADLSTSTIFQLCPNNLTGATSTPGYRRRHLFTTDSFDLDSPGVTPMLWDPFGTDPNTLPTQRYTMPNGIAPNALYPSGDAVPFPTTIPAAPPKPSEFGTDWRAITAALAKIDLNRKLTDFPAPSTLNAQFMITDTATFATAMQDRQNLARDIYIRLCAATGAPCSFPIANTTTSSTPLIPATLPNYPLGTPEYDASRWLAQLAVNIVDFIDNDDFITAFNWNPAANSGGNVDTIERGGWVFGTELNRAVLNEVYIDYINDPTDPLTGGKATLPYLARVWAELHNPLPGSWAMAYDNAQARFMSGTGTATDGRYQILITHLNAKLRNPDNVRGVPDSQVYSTFNNWTNTIPAPGAITLAPAGTNAANGSFLFVGPTKKDDPTKADNGDFQTATNQVSSDAMRFPVADATGTRQQSLDPPTLLLQRLACPYLPPQPNPTQALYNPYITVDYVDMTYWDPTNPGKEIYPAWTTDNFGQPPPSPTLPKDRSSWGRQQPYAAHSTMRVAQQGGNGTEPQHTFAPNVQANKPASNPFDWLSFRDRPLINVGEVLEVPGFKPHELTQQFMFYPVDPNTNMLGNLMKFQHLAPWSTDPSTGASSPYARLYRALEWLTTQDRAAGMNLGGRIAGRVNINTIYDQETVNALVDQNSSNQFNNTAFANNLWANLVQKRTPNLNATKDQIQSADKPFKSLANPFATGAQYPSGTTGSGIGQQTDGNNTMLGGLFQTTANPSHPNLNNELLTKILGNVTTRSNVFAVWLTVGYFEVVDYEVVGNAPPRPKLGAEFKPQGWPVRQQGFAIIDRTGLSLLNDGTTAAAPDQLLAAGSPVTCGPVTQVGWQSPAVGQPTGAAIVPITALSGSFATGVTWGPATMNWQIQPGSLLRIDTGANAEVVTVLDVDTTAKTFTAQFARLHNAGAQAAMLGNPGPQGTIFSWTNLTRYGQVVRHTQRLN